MEKPYFKKMEDKYVFNLSLVFWHFLVVLASLGTIGGVLFFIWGLLPPSKPTVAKPEFPSSVAVSPAELKAKVIPRAKREAPRVQPARVEEVKPTKKEEPHVSALPEQAETEPGKEEYDASLARLEQLIPPDKYAWKSKGHWEYPYGKSYWEKYKDKKYRKWVVDRLGVEGRLRRGYRAAKAEDFVAKKTLIDSYISVIEMFDEEARVKALNALVMYSKESVSQSIANVALLRESVPNFSPDRTDFLEILAEFGKKNPKDGRSFIGFANRILGNFDTDARLAMLQSLIVCYYRHFNNYIDHQIEITNGFLPMVEQFDAEYQPRALEEYYVIYFKKNEDRVAGIKRIDRQYQRDLNDAERAYAHKGEEKADYRKKGLYVIGGGIALIAVTGWILALLAIQRRLETIHASLQATKGAQG